MSDNRPPNAKRSPARKAADDKRAAEMYLQGSRYRDIADALGIDKSTVAKHIQSLLEEWREDAVKDIALAKQLELARIDSLELRYWEAWEKSLKKIVSTSVKTRPSFPGLPNQSDRSGMNEVDEDLEPEARPHHRVRPAPGDNQEIILERLIKTEATSGNPAWLQGIQWCINKRCEIMGLNAPRRVEASGPGGGPIRTDASGVQTVISVEDLDAARRVALDYEKRLLGENPSD